MGNVIDLEEYIKKNYFKTSILKARKEFFLSENSFVPLACYESLSFFKQNSFGSVFSFSKVNDPNSWDVDV